jgi:hypothetical protein
MGYPRPGVNRSSSKSLVSAVAGLREVFLAALTVGAAAGCGGAHGEASWPPLAKKWFDRADASYHQGDVEDAELSIANALRVVPEDPKVRLLGARIALAQLEYERSIQLLAGLDMREAGSVRGRAYWYSGKLDQAADELERLVSDPEVRDPWASDVAKLARRGGGRKPFQMTGGLLAVSEMPQVSSTALVVPLEVNGEPALAMIATATAEAVIDAGRGAEPSWISLRFGERIEVKDVPALAKDLSGLSRQLNAPIKVLIGVNLLRHLHPTFDFTGSQFVVRSYDPPPPHHATTVPVSYVRGGGMLLRGALGAEQSAPMASLLVDTSMNVPVALDDAGWKKAGVALNSLRAVPSVHGLMQGVLPMLRLGAFEVPRVPGVRGAPIADFEKGLDIELDGLLGSGLLAAFRVTLVDGGRNLWLEDIPPEAIAGAKRPPEMPADVEPDDSAGPESDETSPASGPGTGKTKPKEPSAPSAKPPRPAAPAPSSETSPSRATPGSGAPGAPARPSSGGPSSSR